VLELYRGVVGSRVLRVVVTERTDGDQRPVAGTRRGTRRVTRPATLSTQRAITGRTWAMADEEHGVAVVEVVQTAMTSKTAGADDSGASGALGQQPLPVGDVLVTEQTDVPLAVWAGDCAPLVLCGAKGTLVAVHAGWRGLALGIVDVGIAELSRRGDRAERAILGPCIHAECYEFGAADLAAVAAGIGASVGEIATSRPHGGTSLDVPRAVEIGLSRRGICLDVTGACTSCDDRWFSYRARSEDERHAVVAWTTLA
jgi:polyphenol oxidase